MTEYPDADPLMLAGRLREERQPFAMATVVRVTRPASARVGNRALIMADGSVHGWIGGACSEPAVVLEALRAIDDGEHRIVRVGPTGDSEDEGHIVRAESSCASEGVVDVFVEPQLPAPALRVVGSSPAALTLARLAGEIGWHVSDVDPTDAVVVATMGHGDVDAVEAALASPASYVGLVASQRRASTVADELRERGVSEEAIARLRSPAGLDLGPGGPAEIAVAVLAELVAFRARRGASGTAPTEAVDPVCGMSVAVTPSAEVAESDGVTYYFCSEHCRASFVSDPTQYRTVEQQ